MGVGITLHDRENIDRIMAGYGDWYTAKLLRLIAKADVQNIEKLRRMYPEEVAAYEKWYANDRD